MNFRKFMLTALGVALALLVSACANTGEKACKNHLEFRQVPLSEAIDFYSEHENVQIRYDINDTQGKFIHELGFISFFTWQDGLQHILSPHGLELIQERENENLYHVLRADVSPP